MRLLHTLHDVSTAQKGSFFRLYLGEKGFKVKIQIVGGDPVIPSALFYTNYPSSKSKFSRTSFHQQKFQKDQEGNVFVELELDKPGCFDYFIEYQQKGEGNREGEVKKSVTHHFLIFPQLKLKGQPLPYDGINMETVFANWSGPIEKWDSMFSVLSQSGYNAIHFPPVQQSGISLSPYSIYEQLSFADSIFGKEAASLGFKERREKISSYIKKLETKFGMLSIADVVWNHTACNSPYLPDHPEVGYNLVNSPHLRSAFALDDGLFHLSEKILDICGFDVIDTPGKLDTIMSLIQHELLPSLKLWEFFVLDVAHITSAFEKALKNGIADYDIPNDERPYDEKINLVRTTGLYFDEGKEYDRKGLSINFEVVLSLFFERTHPSDSQKIAHNIEKLTEIVNVLNVDLYKTYDSDVECILNSLRNTLKFERLDDHGPKKKKISLQSPLFDPYFTRVTPPKGKKNQGEYYLANNGWIWGGDPLLDFASKFSKAYFRREVIVWGDSIKFRYGSSPDDCPWLWNHMAEYTRMMASTFHGFRIDNCHSTPLHVGQYLLDVAREANPNLYVVAELFTGSPEKDEIFVSKLGIHSLIREAMAAGGAKELSHIIHRSGGVPVSSVSTKPEYLPKGKGEGDDPHYYPIHGYLPHVMCSDSTHDNQSATQQRQTQDTLSTSAMVAMAPSAMASSRGYDELYPKHIPVPGRSETYPPLLPDSGILKAKSKLLHLHTFLAKEHYSEFHVHQDGDVIALHRIQPQTSNGYLLIAHTAFKGNHSVAPSVSSIKLNRTKIHVEMLAKIEVPEGQSLEISENNVFRGLKSKLEISTSMEGSVDLIEWEDDRGSWKEFKFVNFPPGSILLLKTSPDKEASHSIDCITSYMGLGLQKNIGWYLDGICRYCPEAHKAVESLNLLSLNILLYRSDVEERDFTGMHGSYSVPNFSVLPFCGLQGCVTFLKRIIYHNDMGHPIFDNLRAGPWFLDYIVDRLYRYLPSFPELKATIVWLRTVLEDVRKLPNFLVPRYFTVVIMTLYHAAVSRACSLMSEFVQKGGEMTRGLALGSVQLLGHIKSSSLLPQKDLPALAAGLPHFATNYMRCWGRDTFISLRGLMMVTGRFDVAKNHIISFARTLRHGLIPNLLDSGRNPRYNCRDAAWWFLQSIQDYCLLAPEGLAFLDSKVARHFPTDDYVPGPDPVPLPLVSMKEIITEILQRHANGISFRERNAGPNLDRCMRDEGFNVNVYVDWENGFVCGGNPMNCGTWMDKMGDSQKAGNFGIPSSPRDGADVEIIGLLKSTLRWLTEIDFEPSGVEVTINGEKVFKSFKEWNDLVGSSFEKYFYVPLNPEEDGNYKIRADHVNRRGIYKDTWKSSSGWGDYQLRPNMGVAMVVAPEMFSPPKAQHALSLLLHSLKAPLGMRTLDPSDFNYRPNYHNGDDSHDYSVAKGFNYHQGPEWVWCTGYFLRAYLIFFAPDDPEGVSNQVLGMMKRHREMILHESDWAGLPELTNENGAHCPDSCPSQAWSFATILETLFHLASLS